jgi:hypothetical protein
MITVALQRFPKSQHTRCLSQVATSGSYLSLSDAPNLSVYALSNGLSQVATTGSFLSLSDTPNLGVYALSNSIQQSDWFQSDVSNMSYIANKPANLSQFANDSGFIVQNTSPTLQALTITGDLIVANGVLHTNVSPVFNGSFWSISDNPIERPSALSEALKIGGYIFDSGQVLWDGAQQAQLMFNQGQMADALATQQAENVLDKLNDESSSLSVNWGKISSRPIADSGGDIGLTGGLFLSGKIYRDSGVYQTSVEALYGAARTVRTPCWTSHLPRA